MKRKSLPTGTSAKYEDISKWGRLRALPVADEASNKEWQRSKFGELMRATNFGHRNRIEEATPIRSFPRLCFYKFHILLRRSTQVVEEA